jgi:hypothetical protein
MVVIRFRRVPSRQQMLCRKVRRKATKQAMCLLAHMEILMPPQKTHALACEAGLRYDLWRLRFSETRLSASSPIGS